jgi:hypothetical protein
VLCGDEQEVHDWKNGSKMGKKCRVRVRRFWRQRAERGGLNSYKEEAAAKERIWNPSNSGIGTGMVHGSPERKSARLVNMYVLLHAGEKFLGYLGRGNLPCRQLATSRGREKKDVV